MNLLSRIKKKLYTQKYVVGFLKFDEIQLSDKERFSKVRWLKLGKYSDGWFADPFILSVDSNYIILLVEEYLWATKRGRISKLIVDAYDYRLLSVIPLLDIDTHLSFPIYIRDSGFLYVYPENYQGGALRLYRYDEENDKLVEPHILINKPLLDAQIVKIADSYFIFAIEYIKGTQEDCKYLKIYRGDVLTGPYSLFQEIKNEYCYERGAGMIYKDENGCLLRPSQNCEGDYGLSTIISQITFDEKEQKFIESRRNNIIPDYDKRYGRGLHTFNLLDNLCVVDGRGFRYKISDLVKRKFLNR